MVRFQPDPARSAASSPWLDGNHNFCGRGSLLLSRHLNLAAHVSHLLHHHQSTLHLLHAFLPASRLSPGLLPYPIAGDPPPTTFIDYGLAMSDAYGSAPVYGVGGPALSSTWGEYFDVICVADPQLTGMVLVRTRDLQSDRVGVFVGSYAAGDVVGTDTISGKTVQQHADLVLDTSHHPVTSGTSKWGVWKVRQGLAAGWSHCFGIQVDDAGFTEVATGIG